MAKINRIAPDPSDTAPVTLEQVESAYADAETEFEMLIAQRHEKRATLPKAEWRQYNDDTTDQQLEAQANLEEARKQLSRFHGTERGQTVSVGPASESGQAGGR